MKTVSNSVRTIAPVGQTSMQLACWQCLQTSDMSRNALPSPTPSVSSGTLSMNFTWRQVWPSSVPVLSRLSPRKPSGLLGSWFHSLHATSHALHPMQTLVSVKNPYDLPGSIFSFASAIARTPWVLGCLSQALDRRVKIGGEG